MLILKDFPFIVHSLDWLKHIFKTNPLRKKKRGQVQEFPVHFSNVLEILASLQVFIVHLNNLHDIIVIFFPEN